MLISKRCHTAGLRQVAIYHALIKAIKLFLGLPHVIFPSLSPLKPVLPILGSSTPPQLHFLLSLYSTPCSYLDYFHPAFPASPPNS